MGWREHHIDWQAAIRGVPVEDYLDGHDLGSAAGRVEAVESFTRLLELRRWHAWEAVIRDEQGLPLCEAHELLLDELVGFSEDEDERVLYINDSARPCEPWYVSARRLAETLRVSRYDTAADHHEGVLTAGEDLILAIETHGEHLSLPPDARWRRDAIGPELWDRLTIQVALDMFSGVGRGGAPVTGDMVDLFLRLLGGRISAVVGLGVLGASVLKITLRASPSLPWSN